MEDLDPRLHDGINERVACVLLLDTSRSMFDSDRIGKLNQGLQCFKEALDDDPVARERAEICVVTFGGSVQIGQFIEAREFQAPVLSASGLTPMGEAIRSALRVLEERVRTYNSNGTKTWRPWVILLTDGAPTDAENIPIATRLIHEGETKTNGFSFFGVGVGDGADMDRLRLLCPPSRPPKTLSETSFTEFFQWLSRQLQSITRSQEGEMVKLEPTSGWEQAPAT